MLTDAARSDVSRAIQPDETDLGRVAAASAPRPGRVPRSVAGARGHDLRGWAVHPDTGEHYTYDATPNGFSRSSGGRVESPAYDATDLSVDDVRGVVLAPSADPTDHPSELSVYVVDHGAPGNFGEIVEATIASDVAARGGRDADGHPRPCRPRRTTRRARTRPEWPTSPASTGSSSPTAR